MLSERWVHDYIAYPSDVAHLISITEQYLGFVLGSALANSRSVPAMAGATLAGVGLCASELAKCPEVGSPKPA